MPMAFPYEEFDLSGVRTYPLESRASKARVEDFGRPFEGGRFKRWFDSLPHILGAEDLRKAARALVDARARDGGIVWGLGAHVIKTGVSPVLIDLMKRGFVSALALNGAGIIHDFEIALSGGTSEDVDESLGPGRFGMAEETGVLLNEAIRHGATEGQGLGQAVARVLADRNPPHADLSLAVAAHRLGIPLTVHVAMGTDIIHMHPTASGAAIGEASLRDFRFFVSSVARLRGGVYLNCGSAVVLPEVFLKAVALARNRGASLDGLTTVNIDFLRMYRPQINVLTRPVEGTGGVGISLVGHHEVLIPLLAAAAIEGV
jgi:hypothetical protein